MMFPSLSNRPSLSSRHSGLASSRERLRPLLLLATVWLGAALVHQDVSWLDAGLGGIALVAALLRLRERPAQGDDTAHPSPVRCHGRHQEYPLTRVSSSLSVAASLTLVVIWLLQ